MLPGFTGAFDGALVLLLQWRPDLRTPRSKTENMIYSPQGAAAQRAFGARRE